jgi:hypothetical protein
VSGGNAIVFSQCVRLYGANPAKVVAREKKVVDPVVVEIDIEMLVDERMHRRVHDLCICMRCAPDCTRARHGRVSQQSSTHPRIQDFRFAMLSPLRGCSLSTD